MKKSTFMHSFVSNVIGGSALTQRSIALGIDILHMEDSEVDDITSEIYEELTKKLGLNFDQISYDTLVSILRLLSEPNVMVIHKKRLSRILWKILGDPTNNGDTPPPVYAVAANCIYNWMLASLKPTYDVP